jgi:FG-GAP repeat protein
MMRAVIRFPFPETSRSSERLNLSTTGPAPLKFFAFDGVTWTQQAKLIAADAVDGDNFGRSVSLSGQRALIGAWAKNTAAGVAYVFELNGATWRQTAELIADDSSPNSYFGLSLSLSGTRALIGAPGKSAAYIFDFAGSSWIQTARLTADGVSSDVFGDAVSVSGDRALVGAWDQNDNAGAA